MKAKKILAIAAAALLTMTAFTACGNSETASTSSESSASESSVSESSASESSEESSETEQLQIEPPEESDISSGKAAFLAQYSGKIKRQNQILLYNSATNPLTAVKNIDKKAREFIEETGVNVAYVAPCSLILARLNDCLCEMDKLDNWCHFRNLLSKLDDQQVVPYIHIKYDGLGFIPLNELMKEETA